MTDKNTEKTIEERAREIVDKILYDDNEYQRISQEFEESKNN